MSRTSRFFLLAVFIFAIAIPVDARSTEIPVNKFSTGVFAADTIRPTYKFSGWVVDKEEKIPIPWASVVVVGTRNGMVSKDDGWFSLQVRKGDTVSFSTVNHQAKEIRITKKMLKKKQTIRLRKRIVYMGI